MIVNPEEGVFEALASLPRRRMLSFLSQTALSTVELAERFGMSAPAVSRHLAVLQRAGLVSGEREGRRVLYRLNRDTLLGALARLASEVDGPLRRAPPREAL
jgi:DNA-binding transcriptional ArsR family regulator